MRDTRKDKPSYTIEGTLYSLKLNAKEPGDKFEVKLMFNSADDPVLKQIMSDNAKNKVRSKPYNLKDDNGNDTGQILYRMDSRAWFNEQDGTLLNPLPVRDKFNKPLTTPVGRGSKVIISYTLRDYEHQGKKGVTQDLQGIQVRELVPYIPQRREDNLFKPLEDDPEVAEELRREQREGTPF